MLFALLHPLIEALLRLEQLLLQGTVIRDDVREVLSSFGVGRLDHLEDVGHLELLNRLLSLSRVLLLELEHKLLLSRAMLPVVPKGVIVRSGLLL